jgi:hypothetical protein
MTKAKIGHRYASAGKKVHKLWNNKKNGSINIRYTSW